MKTIKQVYKKTSDFISKYGTLIMAIYYAIDTIFDFVFKPHVSYTSLAITNGLVAFLLLFSFLDHKRTDDLFKLIKEQGDIITKVLDENDKLLVTLKKCKKFIQERL